MIELHNLLTNYIFKFYYLYDNKIVFFFTFLTKFNIK